MLRRLWPKLLVQIVGLSVLAMPVQANCSKIITFGVIDWPPYIVWGGEQKPSGLDIALIDGIFNEVDCKYEIRHMPFKRTLRDVETGQIDASPFVSITEERALFGFYSLPVRPEIIGAFMVASRKDGALPADFNALAQSSLTIGIVLGGWYGPAFDSAREQVPGFRERVTSFEHFKDLFRALQTGAIDVAINDMAGGNYMARRLGADEDILPLPFAVHKNDVHLFFSRKSVSARDAALIDAAILSFQQSDTYNKLLARHLPKDMLTNSSPNNK